MLSKQRHKTLTLYLMLRKILLILLLLTFWSCSDFHEEPPVQKESPGKKKVFILPRNPNPRDQHLTSTDKVNTLKFTKPDHRIDNKKNSKPTFYQPTISRFGNQKPIGDSLFLAKIKQLRIEDVELDLTEPLSRTYLFSELESITKKGFISVNKERFININFENDILDNTDRYYTNGIKIDIISPFLRPFPMNYLMIPYWGAGINYYGISIVQNLYTPSTTKSGGILYGDRPYAAYLYLGSFKISNDPQKKFRQTTELDIGVIGPYSFGGFVQKSFHASIPTNSEPLGWLYQIQNDLVLNYQLCYEKAIVSERNIDLNITAKSAIGTLYTNFGGGMMVRSGIFNPYFANLGISRSHLNHQNKLRNTQIYFFLTTEGKVIGYDATLEGGMFNHKSVYTLTDRDISRFVFSGCAGIVLNTGGFRFDIGQNILSPEFHHGMWHHWVKTGLTFTW
jgi:lipid A 3-O-deacylase